MFKLQNEILISEEQEKEVLELIEGITQVDYMNYKSSWNEGGMGLGNKFLLFGILCNRKNKRALELRDILNNTHWKKDREYTEKINENIKIAEIKKNKEDYCEKKRKDPSEKLSILKEYYVKGLGNNVVVGLVDIGENGRTIFGGTTCISEFTTPTLYEKIKQNYKHFLDNY